MTLNISRISDSTTLFINFVSQQTAKIERVALNIINLLLRMKIK